MKSDRKTLFLFSAGVILMAVIATAQITSDLIHGTLFYILLTFYGLWLLRQSRYPYGVGVVTTLAMSAGYFFGSENSGGALISLIFSLLLVWTGVLVTVRFRDLYQTEQKYKNQLKATFENVSEAILLVDTTGKIILGNPGAERILGYSQQELRTMHVEALIPDRFRPNHDFHRGTFVRNPTNRQVGVGKDVFALTKNGKEVPVEVSLSSYYDNGELFIIAFVTDITKRREQEARIAAQYEAMERCNLRLEEQVRFRTSELEIINQNLVREIEERKLVEQQLRKSQLLYKAVANNFPDGIIGVLNKNLEYLFVEGKELSRPLRDINGYRGLSLTDVPTYLVKNAEDKLRPVFDGGNVSFEMAIGNNHYEVVATPFSDLDSHIAEILVVIRNISKHKKLEEDLLRALDKEKQLNVLKSRFVTSVSHEFRTPLSTILSSVFLLENYRGADMETFNKTHHNRIKRSVNSLTELLDDFLSLGRLEEGKVKVTYSEFYVREFFDEIISEMDAIKNKDQHIVLDFKGDDDLVMLDRTLLTNILLNLISNAVKYSHPDGVVEVKAEIRDNLFCLQVIDFGMGIPEKEQKHIFKRFFRAQNAVNIQGTGLGLNLVRKYVRLLKGNISFTSTLNQGSTFTVNIPVAIPNNSPIPNQKIYV